jgi:hypothetical protein
MRVVGRSRKFFMSTANRTRQFMSFQQHWNGNPCPYALIDGVKRRPAVDPASFGEMVT